ncbi:MAG: AAA family ATPase [Bdellovibrionota bacterium]
MKRIIDWSKGRERTDTTGLSDNKITTALVAYAVLSKREWFDQCKSGAVSADQLYAQFRELSEFVFGVDESAESLAEKGREESDKLYDAIKTKAFERFTWDDTICVDVYKERSFRSNIRFCSILFHLGAISLSDEANDAEILRDKNSVEIRPKSQAKVYQKDWMLFAPPTFSSFVSYLQSNIEYEDLVVINFSKDETTFCEKSIGKTQGIRQTLQSTSPKFSGDSVLSRKYIIFHGPPGTGKTREAYKFTNKILSSHVETYSNGEVKANVFASSWPEDHERQQLFQKFHRLFCSTTQFHASYGYEDFIEGIKPIPSAKGIRYEVIDGTFMATWRKATGIHADVLISKVTQSDDSTLLYPESIYVSLYDLDIDGFEVLIPGHPEPLQGIYDTSEKCLRINKINTDKLGDEFVAKIRGNSWGQPFDYFIFIDEINRGKVAKIFGELLLALSVADEGSAPEVRTQYSKTPLFLPNNLHIIATMNTTDKSIDLLDQAFRRRFEFIELTPLRAEDAVSQIEWKDLIAAYKKTLNIDIAQWLKDLNESLVRKGQIDHDRQIGHSYFFKALKESKKPKAKNLHFKDEKTFLSWTLFKVYVQDIFPVLQDFFPSDRDGLTAIVPEHLVDAHTCSLRNDIRDLVRKDHLLQFSEEDFKVWDTKVKPDFLTVFLSEANLKKSA